MLSAQAEWSFKNAGHISPSFLFPSTGVARLLDGATHNRGESSLINLLACILY